MHNSDMQTSWCAVKTESALGMSATDCCSIEDMLSFCCFHLTTSESPRHYARDTMTCRSWNLITCISSKHRQLFWSVCRDQRLYKAALSGDKCEVTPLTEADNKLRFADAVIDEQRNRLITVCEDHSGDGEAVNTIAAVGKPPAKPLPP